MGLPLTTRRLSAQPSAHGAVSCQLLQVQDVPYGGGRQRCVTQILDRLVGAGVQMVTHAGDASTPSASKQTADTAGLPVRSGNPADRARVRAR